MYRLPKTTAEIRAIPDAAENGVKVRAKRSRRNIPNSYDDLQQNKTREKSNKGKNKHRA